MADQNMKAHVATYSKVMTMMKWGTVGCAIVAIGVILLIAR